MRTIVSSLFLSGLICVTGLDAFAQIKPNLTAGNPSVVEQKALKMYERITGVNSPLDNPAIAQMVALIDKGDLLGAAKIATADDNFLNITVKLMALEMSTRNETIKTPFNDMVASFIGVTRDQTDARELLTGNFYYMGRSPSPDITIRSVFARDLLLENTHYNDLEANDVNLAKNLIRMEGQQVITNVSTPDEGQTFVYSVAPSPDPAGVLTSRSFMGEHADQGTNRRLVEYAFRQFMCVPLSEWADPNATDAWIGRDIDRFPAGDHTKFLTTCKGCHTVMDGFRGAFAKWDTISNFSLGRTPMHSDAVSPANDFFSSEVRKDSRGIMAKMNKNNNIYPSGYVTVDDSFVNNATRTANSELFGWRGNYQRGRGTKEFGAMIANSRRFSQCMAKRAFKAVCRKDLPAATSTTLLKKWGDEFEASGYKLKSLFESIATKPECLD